MKINKKTSDAEIAELTEEEILHRFEVAKNQASFYEAERDRLRDYIKENVPQGEHGMFKLEKVPQKARTYATSEGLAYLRDLGVKEYFTEKPTIRLKVTLC